MEDSQEEGVFELNLKVLQVEEERVPKQQDSMDKDMEDEIAWLLGKQSIFQYDWDYVLCGERRQRKQQKIGLWKQARAFPQI